MRARPGLRFRTLASLSLLAAGALVVAGCSPAADDATDGDPVTITFAASTFGDPGRGEGLQALLDEYNSSQDEVIVEPASVPFPTFAQTVLTQMGAGSGPDLIRFNMAEFESAAEAGLLEPLTDSIDAEALGLIPGPDQYLIKDGERYGVVFENSNYGLFYNADLIPNPPTTFEEFVQIAQELTQGDTYGLAFRQTQAEEAGVWQDIQNYVLGFGGGWSDGETLTIDSPENIEGLEAFQMLYDMAVIPQGADAATFRQMFAEGLIGMEINNGGYATATTANNPDLNFSVAEIPFPVRSQGTLLTPMVMNVHSEHKEAVLDFMTWLLEPEQQSQLQEVLGASSVAIETERSAESLELYPFLPVLDAMTESGVPQLVLGYEARTPELRTIIVTEVLSALQGEKDMATALQAAQQQAEELVGQ